MKRTRWIALGCALACMFGTGSFVTPGSFPELSIMARAEETFTSGDFTYQLNDGTGPAITITGYSGTDEALVIPAKLDGHIVDAVGDWRLNQSIIKTGGSKVRSVTFPKDSKVTLIYGHAFDGCDDLEEVNLLGSPEQFVLDAYAFADFTKLKKVTISDTVQQIGIGAYAFSGCAALTEFPFTDQLQSIDVAAFSNTGLKALDFHALTHEIGIGEQAFEGSAVETVDFFPNWCVAFRTFANCTQLTSVKLAKWTGGGGEVNVPVQIFSEAFNGCSNLQTVELPSEMQSIHGNAFEDCISLESITLPEGITLEGEAQFRNCLKLEDITIPASVKTIPDSCFTNTGLTSVSLPDTVTEIGFSAFAACPHLHDVTLPASVQKINSYAFQNCPMLRSVTIENAHCVIDNFAVTICGFCNELGEPVYNGTIRSYDNFDYKTVCKDHGYKFESLGAGTDQPAEPSSEEPTKPSSEEPTKPSSEEPTRPSEKPEPVEYRFDPFEDGVNNWSFLNSTRNFTRNYVINDKYMRTLLKNTKRTEQARIKRQLEKSFRGSCFGMAITSILSCYGILDPAQYQAGAATLHDIEGPPNEEVMSLINYYYALQFTDAYRQEILHLPKSEAERISILLDQLQDKSPTLLTYYTQFGGHAVVAYDAVYGKYSIDGSDYNVKVLVYDNKNADFSDDYCLYINTASSQWTIPADPDASTEKKASLNLSVDDPNLLNVHGYLQDSGYTSDHEFIPTRGCTRINCTYSIRRVDLSDSNWTIHSSVDDDIELFYTYADGDDIGGDLLFAVPGEELGCIMTFNSAEAIEQTMSYANDFMTAQFDAALKAIFDPSGYIEVSGAESEFYLNMVSNEGYYPTDWYEVAVSGTGSDVSLKKVENGYIFHSDTMQDIAVAAANDRTRPMVEFSTDYDEVLIYEIQENVIGIAVDADGNGSYETTIAQGDPDVLTVYGDADESGVVDIIDVIKVNKFLLGTDKLSDTSRLLADVDRDGDVTPMDSLNILKYVVQLIQSFDEVS